MKKMTRIIHAPLAAITLGWLAVQFAPNGFGVVPPPDGAYPGGNTAEGLNALLSLSTGGFNTAVGWLSLRAVTDGQFNTATGAGALALNTASGNTAIGAGALLFNSTGTGNTANGFQALFSHSVGDFNTAVGANALAAHVSGSDNTAVGASALGDSSSGNLNTAIGAGALRNTTGDHNTALGNAALNSDTDGTGNTAVGNSALLANTSGVNNTALGFSAGTNQITGDGNVYIGSVVGGVDGENNHTYIRNINVTNVSGGGTDTVTVNLATGLLGHVTSSRRYKEDIKPIADASEGLYRLKPVSYRYKKEIDSIQSPAYGLIAEQVAEVNPALVARNTDGQPESVHYEMVNAMLLNEFLKEHRKVGMQNRKIQEQETTIAELKKQVQTVVAHAKEQDSKIQRVSDRVQINSSPVVVIDR